MKRFDHIILLALFSVCLVCCTRTADVEQTGDDRIVFYGRNVFLQTGTKGIVPEDESLTLPIYVTDDSESDAAFSAAEILYHSDNGLWYSDYYTWKSGKRYRIYAYILSKGTGDNAGSIDIEEDTAAPERKSGTKFKVSQPAGYSENPDSYADFLLSYPVTVDGTDKPLVVLDFERTMACVELYMTRTANNPEVRLNSATFSQVFTSAEYRLYFHGDGDRDGMKNVWQVTESERKDYTFSGTKYLTEKDTDERFDEKYRIMRFLVPDQSLDANHKLTLKYQASEGTGALGAEVTAEFDLSGYKVESWSYGHRIRYYISIDTGATLEGIVDQWRDVDYIEGTFLPD